MVKKGLQEDTGNNFGNRLFRAVEPKFNRNEWTGVVDGYGYKCL
jgi:hypothetical protein